MSGVYEEGQIKRHFIEGVLPNLRQSISAYWGGHKRAALTMLAKYADSLRALTEPTTVPQHTSKKKGDRGSSQSMTVRPLNTSDSI